MTRAHSGLLRYLKVLKIHSCVHVYGTFKKNIRCLVDRLAFIPLSKHYSYDIWHAFVFTILQEISVGILLMYICSMCVCVYPVTLSEDECM